MTETMESRPNPPFAVCLWHFLPVIAVVVALVSVTGALQRWRPSDFLYFHLFEYEDRQSTGLFVGLHVGLLWCFAMLPIRLFELRRGREGVIRPAIWGTVVATLLAIVPEAMEVSHVFRYCSYSNIPLSNMPLRMLIPEPSGLMVATGFIGGLLAGVLAKRVRLTGRAAT